MAPVGKLRWQEAIPLSAYSAECPSQLEAHRSDYRCVQRESGSGSTLVGSEDCLYMYIWTPADIDLSSSRLDVMVHIHDGGLMTGSGHEPCKFFVVHNPHAADHWLIFLAVVLYFNNVFDTTISIVVINVRKK